MIAEPPGGEVFGQVGSPSIFDELRQIGSGDYQYYRQPNGWIDFGQIGKNRSYETHFMQSGWKPLGGPHAATLGTNDYGVFALEEYHLSHPHEVLFMRGGAKELPAEQVMALGYHLNPPLIPRCGLQVGAEHARASGGRRQHLSVCWRGAKRVTFPQLAGKTLTPPGGCPFCHREDFPSVASRNQHVSVMHKSEMQQMSLADAIVKGVQAAQGATAPSEVDEAARMAAEQREIDEKMRAMGLLDDDADQLQLTQDELLAASQRRPHRKRAE